MNFFKLDFSKKITVIVIVFWIVSIIITGVIKTLIDKDLSFLLEYIQPVAFLTITTYSVKAGSENVLKIINSNNSNTNSQV